LAILKTYTIFAKLIFKTYMIMKITKHFLLLLLMAISFASCENSEDEPPQPAMYFLKWDMNNASKYAKRVHLEVFAFEYNDQNEVMKVRNVNHASLVDGKAFTANERTTKVVVRFDFEFDDNGSTWETSLYSTEVFYLYKDRTTTITINGESMCQKYNPIR
jgi:hypothetical protein